MTNENETSFKATVTEVKPCSTSLKVEISKAIVDKETEKVFNQIQSQASVPGFRKGKAPMGTIKTTYADNAKQQVLENLIKEYVFAALDAQKINPVSFPDVKDVDFDLDKGLNFSITAETHPEVELKKYKGLKINKEVKEITEDTVTKTINGLKERNSTLKESAEDTVKDGLFVLVDSKGFIDGKEDKAMEGTNQMVDTSAAQILDGFKDGLMGMKKGEEKDITVKFPKDYYKKEYAEKEAVIKVTVKEIKEKISPEVNDEFAKDFGADSLDDLKAKIKDSLTQEEENRQKQDIERQIVDALHGENEFEVPSSLVGQQHKYIMERSHKYFQSQGMPEDVIESNKKKFEEKYKKEAEKNVRISYILNKIAEVEKLDPSEEELQADLKKMKESNPGKEKEIEDYFAKNKEKIASGIKEDKLFKFLIDNAEVKEKITKA